MTDTARELVSTGITGVDDILDGGFTHRRLVLVEGVPGSGKTTMLNEPASIWNPDGPAMTAADSQAAKEAQAKRQAAFQRPTDPKALQELRQASYDRAYRLKAAGALGLLTDGSKEQGLMNMGQFRWKVPPEYSDTGPFERGPQDRKSVV